MEDANKPKRRDDIRVLCPIHDVGMRGPDDALREIYWCWRPACPMYWDARSEYFTFGGGGPTSLQMRQRVLCPKPGYGHMFLAHVRRRRLFWGPKRLFGNVRWTDARKEKKGHWNQ
jgi:hypothetical protein